MSEHTYFSAAVTAGIDAVMAIQASLPGVEATLGTTPYDHGILLMLPLHDGEIGVKTLLTRIERDLRALEAWQGRWP